MVHSSQVLFFWLPCSVVQRSSQGAFYFVVTHPGPKRQCLVNKMIYGLLFLKKCDIWLDFVILDRLRIGFTSDLLC